MFNSFLHILKPYVFQARMMEVWQACAISNARPRKAFSPASLACPERLSLTRTSRSWHRDRPLWARTPQRPMVPQQLAWPQAPQHLPHVRLLLPVPQQAPLLLPLLLLLLSQVLLPLLLLQGKLLMLPQVYDVKELSLSPSLSPQFLGKMSFVRDLGNLI